MVVVKDTYLMLRLRVCCYGYGFFVMVIDLLFRLRVFRYSF